MNLDLTDPRLIVLTAVVVLVLVVVSWLYVRRRQTATGKLKHKFGTEYDRAVGEFGSTRLAETKLEEREKRVEKFSLRDLDPMERERFAKQWSPLSLVLSIHLEGRSQELMIW